LYLIRNFSVHQDGNQLPIAAVPIDKKVDRLSWPRLRKLLNHVIHVANSKTANA
jgi:hypothetical protein